MDIDTAAGRRRIVGEFGLPEVDKVLQGSLFTQRRHSNSPLQSVRSIQQGNPLNILRESHSRPSVDRISELPDAVLEFIVSLLTMREAAATSVLSRRWKDLWSDSASCFDFDLSNLTGSNTLRSLIDNSSEALERERSRFTQWIEHVLQTRRSSSVEALRISFSMGEESASDLDRWITHAASHGVRELELEYSPFTDAAYDFPFEPFPCLEYLRLVGCNFIYPPDFGGFKSLVSLTLIQMFITTDTLQNILSDCSSLERLSLLHCYHLCEFVGSLKLSFSSPSLRLKHLRLHMKPDDDVANIEVHNVKLMSLEFDGSETQLSIKNLPHLARLVLCTGKPVDIQSDLPRLETLFVNAELWDKETTLLKLTALKNLRQLVFLANGNSTNLREVIRLLEACPLLQKLELDLGISRRTLTWGRMGCGSGILYTNLKEVEIFGLEDCPEKIELIIYLLKHAVALQRMDIFHISRYYIGDAQWILHGDASSGKSTEAAAVKTQILLKNVGRRLQKEARPSTKLVLHPGNYTFLS